MLCKNIIITISSPLSGQPEIMQKNPLALSHARGFNLCDFITNILWQNCLAPEKSYFAADARHRRAGILVCISSGCNNADVQNTPFSGICFLMWRLLFSAAFLVSYYILPEHFHSCVKLRTELGTALQLSLRILSKAEFFFISELMLQTCP